MKIRTLVLALAAQLSAFIIAAPTHAQPLVSIKTVTVGDAGNAADNTGYGAVANVFAIGKYEVTISQYTTFLNSVAATNTSDFIIDLWHPYMQTEPSPLIGGTISRSGILGSYSYDVIGDGKRPIAFVSWFDAARFANWMNNGATNGASTETGAYALNGATNGVGFVRAEGATWWIPSEDEWYKAAYYKGGGPDAGYWLYPTQNDAEPIAEANPPGGSNSANFGLVRNSGDGLTPVGSYLDSISAYGTFDQGGNVAEWNETVYLDSALGIRGGSFFYPGSQLSSLNYDFKNPEFATGYDTGFRVATVPEPSTYALLAMTAAGALWLARRRRGPNDLAAQSKREISVIRD